MTKILSKVKPKGGKNPPKPFESIPKSVRSKNTHRIDGVVGE